MSSIASTTNLSEPLDQDHATVTNMTACSSLLSLALVPMLDHASPAVPQKGLHIDI